MHAEEAIGEHYIEGMLTSAQFDQLLQFVSDHPGLLELEHGVVVLHMASEQAVIRLLGRKVDYSESIGTLPQIQHNEDMATLRALLMAIEIADPRPCGAPWSGPAWRLLD